MTLTKKASKMRVKGKISFSLRLPKRTTKARLVMRRAAHRE